MRTRPSLLVFIFALAIAAILLGNRYSVARAADNTLRNFTPTEVMSADQAVAFPTDI
jgi:hypothetical protein